MKIFFLLLLVTSSTWATVKFEVRWTEGLRKELLIHCSRNDSTCRSVCQRNDLCSFPETYCRDCIGTGLRISHLIDELGNSIQNDNSFAPLNRVLDLVTSGAFVTLVPNDAYNVIDGVNSLRALKKFEDLCPLGSQQQILLLSVDLDSRKIHKPEVVVCDFYGYSYFYGITSEALVDVDDGSRMNLF